jgi:Flp pilus assembly protein TadG
MTRREGSGSHGQALVEFALGVTIFLVLIMGVFDFGRGIYMFNGVSQAAREIARVTSVHPGTDPTVKASWSQQMIDVVNTQKKLIPNLQDPTIKCLEIDAVTTAPCLPGNFVQVTIVAPYSAITPLLHLLGTWNMKSVSLEEIQ